MYELGYIVVRTTMRGALVQFHPSLTPVVHTTLKEAEAEADRLALVQPQDAFTVMRPVKMVQKPPATTAIPFVLRDEDAPF